MAHTQSTLRFMSFSQGFSITVAPVQFFNCSHCLMFDRVLNSMWDTAETQVQIKVGVKKAKKCFIRLCLQALSM